MSQSSDRRPDAYRVTRQGFTFVLDRDNVEILHSMADFETKGEPALADEFLRLRADAWAETLVDAGAAPGEYAVRVDPHQQKVHFVLAETVVVSADI
jgi:hypothetical protein